MWYTIMLKSDVRFDLQEVKLNLFDNLQWILQLTRVGSFLWTRHALVAEKPPAYLEIKDKKWKRERITSIENEHG